MDTRNSEDVVDTTGLRRWSIKQVERVLEERSVEVIDGVICDTTSASLLVAVWAILSEAQREKAQRVAFAKFGSMCWKVAGNSRT